MLGYLRNNTGNWIIKFFLGIIVIVFIFFFGSTSMGPKPNETVASIGDEDISIKEYRQAYQQLLQRLKAQFGNNLTTEVIEALNVKDQALNQVINNRLLLMQADKFKINISDKELQASLMNEKAFQVNGQFNLDRYKEVLRMNSLTPERFEQFQAQSLKIQRVQEMITGSVAVSDLEARNFYLFQQAKAIVDFIKFDPAAVTGIQPDDEAVKAYFGKHRDQYRSAPMVKASYLVFSPDDHKGKVKVAPDQAKAFYLENEKRFETPETVEARHILFRLDPDASQKDQAAALKKANDIYKKAAAGEDFAMLARTYSEGPSKDRGGYLGSFEKQTMVKPFSDKAFSMKAGEISEPVRTQFGWHIIKVEAHQKAAKKTFEQVAEQITKELALQEMKRLAYDQADEAFGAVIEGDDLEQVAQIAGKTAIETPLFDQAGTGLKLDGKQTFAKAAFELDTDSISDVVQVGNTYYLIYIKEKKAPEDLPLDKVKDQVVKDLTGKMKKDKAREQAAAIAKQIKSAKSLKEIAKANKLTVQTSKPFSRNGFVDAAGNSKAFIEAGFSVDEKQPVHPEVVETPLGFFIIGFNKRELPTDKQIAKNLPQLKQQLAFRKQSQIFQTWLAEVRNQYRITYNPDFIN